MRMGPSHRVYRQRQGAAGFGGNQNDLTARYPELKDMAGMIQAKTAILDGEVVAEPMKRARRPSV